MSVIKVSNFSFCYPNSSENVLSGLDFSVERGETVLVFGESGSGKTTLLSNLKRETAPKGKSTGRIEICGKSVDMLDDFSKVGYVSQSPDNQAVSDTVIRELSFGLENCGYSRKLIDRRVAETACYFGLGDILDKKIQHLSGGQKQLCNLAASLCLEPEVLILDEPCARLDPVSAEKFLHELFRINSELGVTVILSEHFSENILPFCSRVLFIENGRLTFNGNNRDFASFVLTERQELSSAMPAASVFAYEQGIRENLPLTVNEGKNIALKKTANAETEKREQHISGKLLVKAREIRYAYSRNEAPVLKGAELDVYAGEITAVVGGNGEGKSTFMNILAGCAKPAKGKVEYKKGLRTALLPQEVKLLFCRDELFSDLSEFSDKCGYDENDVKNILKAFDLDKYAKTHPYDLSCGEMQRAAFAKLLLLKPQVLFLDEPTKGLDTASKKRFTAVLKDFTAQGGAVVMITHDLDLAASTADKIMMMSMGKTVCCENTEDFLENNRFFTTARVRLLRTANSASVEANGIE